MRRCLIVFALLFGTVAGLAPMPVNAEDASWGCQVLLCAASQNPSWHGVPYCVPPMTRLIAAISKPGFSWPICHEANTGKPGHETYGDCPAGTTVGYSSQNDRGSQGEPDQCVETINICQNSRNRSGSTGLDGMNRGRILGSRDDGCIQQVATPRPRRADPYYFDIPDENGVTERFWFDLNH